MLTVEIYILNLFYKMLVFQTFDEKGLSYIDTSVLLILYKNEDYKTLVEL